MIQVLIESRPKTRLMFEGRHQVTARLIVGLDAASNTMDPASWATVNQLQDIVARCRLASPRLVTEVVARLKARRLIETTPSPVDRRARILKPSAFLIEHDRDFLAALIGHLGLIYPEAGYDLILTRDARSHAVFRGAWAHRAERTVKPFWNNQPMRMLYSRSAGMPILFVTLREQIVHGRCSLTFADIGSMLGVSRTAVRTIFEIGEAAGLFEISRRGGGVVALEPMWDAFDLMLSENVVAYNSVLDDLLAGEQMRPAQDGRGARR